MSTTTTDPTVTPTTTVLPQYTKVQIGGLWFAVTAPMSLLGWVVAPWLAHHVVHSRDPFIDSLVMAFNISLTWMIVLVLILVHREQGSLSWATMKKALWFQAPRDPRTGKGWRVVWLYAVGFLLLSAAINFLPLDPQGPLPRDLPNAVLTDRVRHYFHHNWVGYAMMVFNAFASPIAEELFFRGLLLPRTRAAFGRANVIANGTLFTLYHLHQPWSMPAAFLDGTITQAYATERFRSIWMGMITHVAPAFLVLGVLAAQVLT